MRQIYVHGLGQTPASWEKALAQLRPAGPVDRPDLAELCRDGQVNYQRLYSAFAAVCDAFDEEIALCGLSLGAVLAMHYAIEHPEKVTALVLIAPQYKMPKGLLRLQNILFRFMPGSVFQQTGFEKCAFIRLCKTMAELDFSDSVQRITCPVLVVCGARDAANKKAAAALAARLTGAALKMIPDAGHAVNTETPEKLSDALRDFYAALE